MATLKVSGLQVGQRARILRVEADPETRRRLLEMGLVRGEVLEVRRLAPLGDPMELVVKGYHLSLRRSESDCIDVELEA